MPLPSAGNVLRVRFPGVSHRYSVLKPATVRHVAVAFLALEKSPYFIFRTRAAGLSVFFGSAVFLRAGFFAGVFTVFFGLLFS